MKVVRWLCLLVAVPASSAWLAYAVVHLVRSDTAYHVRVVAPPLGTAPATPVQAQRLQDRQDRWGDLTMFAVAAVAGSLVLSLVSWLLSLRPPPRPPRVP